MTPLAVPDHEKKDPVFIYGALRSGTTVFRLMLDSHPDLSNPGEFDFIFDHLEKNHSGRWAYDLDALRLDRGFTDRDLGIAQTDDARTIAAGFIEQLRRLGSGYFTLNVHRNLEKIAAFFPEAKIIHLVRDPRDVARSSIGMGWAGTTYYGVDHWLETEQEWNDFASRFEPNNLLELRFEDLILNPQAELQRVCKFIGVEFSAEMLNYHSRSTYDAPDASAIQQWKSKQSPREIALVEFKSKQLLLERKYELSGYRLDPPDAIEKLSLLWADKKYKWKFEYRRYGIMNVVMEKLTRWFAKPIHPVFLRRIHEITKKYDK